GGREVRHVVPRAEEVQLLGPPPGEAELVDGRQLGQGQGGLQDARAAAAVVVDAGTGGDAVEVRAEHDDVARVAGRGVGDHVVGGTGVALGVRGQAHHGVVGGELLPGLDTVVRL